MTTVTARKELREAKTNGFCPFCFASGDGKKLTHADGCKIVTDACLRKRTRRAP